MRGKPVKFIKDAMTIATKRPIGVWGIIDKAINSYKEIDINLNVVYEPSMTAEEYKGLYLGSLQHDEAACMALAEYEYYAEMSDRNNYEQVPFKDGFANGRKLNNPWMPLPSMSRIAMKYGVTTDRMKQHWRCVEKGHVTFTPTSAEPIHIDLRKMDKL